MRLDFRAFYCVDHFDGIQWQNFESIFYKTPLGEKIGKHLLTNEEDSQLSLLYLRDFILMKIDTTLTEDQYEVCVNDYVTLFTLQPIHLPTDITTKDIDPPLQ